MLDLINRLLDFSKLEAGQMNCTSVEWTSTRCREQVNRPPRRWPSSAAITLEIDCDPELAEFGADEEKVDTVVSNLISNAIKFTPNGGRIRVETRVNGDRVKVAVSDSGIGIDSRSTSRMFERFVQVDGSSSREFTGTGLGLSLVKGLVELHGGTIQLRQRIGQRLDGSRSTCRCGRWPEAVEESGHAPKKIGKHFADLDTFAEQPTDAATTFSSATADLPLEPAPIRPRTDSGGRRHDRDARADGRDSERRISRAVRPRWARGSGSRRNAIIRI